MTSVRRRNKSGPPVDTGCTTKTRTDTDNETGDSASVTKSNC
jgi:hypothetical protein